MKENCKYFKFEGPSQYVFTYATSVIFNLGPINQRWAV